MNTAHPGPDNAPGADRETRVSVCMATFNGERFIEHQLRSILEQLGPDDEIIISDDGSSDLTLAILRSILDSRITVLPVHPSFGVVENFAHALAHARGQFIFLSDQDDVWLGGKLELCLQELQTADLLVTDCVVVDEALKEMSSSYFANRRGAPGVIQTLVKNRFMGCCMAFRRRVLDAALPFPKDIPMHDSWLGLVALTQGRVVFVNTPLLLYRRHGSALTFSGKTRGRALILKLRDRFNLAIALARRARDLRSNRMKAIKYV